MVADVGHGLGITSGEVAAAIMFSVFISSLANTCHSLGDHHSHLALWWLSIQAGWAGPSTVS